FFQKSVYKGRLDLLVSAHDMVLDRLVGGGRFAAGLAGPEGVARGAVGAFFQKAVDESPLHLVVGGHRLPPQLARLQTVSHAGHLLSQRRFLANHHRPAAAPQPAVAASAAHKSFFLSIAFSSFAFVFPVCKMDSTPLLLGFCCARVGDYLKFKTGSIAGGPACGLADGSAQRGLGGLAAAGLGFTGQRGPSSGYPFGCLLVGAVFEL